MPSMLVVPGRRYPECPQGRVYDIKDNSRGGEREACTAEGCNSECPGGRGRRESEWDGMGGAEGGHNMLMVLP